MPIARRRLGRASPNPQQSASRSPQRDDALLVEARVSRIRLLRRPDRSCRLEGSLGRRERKLQGAFIDDAVARLERTSRPVFQPRAHALPALGALWIVTRASGAFGELSRVTRFFNSEPSFQIVAASMRGAAVSPAVDVNAILPRESRRKPCELLDP